jgi:hypothetical protein
MNSWVVAALVLLAVVVGGSYTWLGLSARKHLAPRASECDRSIGWLFWWSFTPSLYDDEGKKLCRKANILVAPIAALYVAWYLLLVK